MPSPRSTRRSLAEAPPNRRRRGAAAHRTGQQAEDVAREALVQEGWVILAQRERTPAGEIDLIAEKAGLLAFVEVKARPSLREAAYALGPKQQARLLAAGEFWLGAHPGRGEAGVRFDVLLVTADGTVKRITDALRLM